MPSTQTTSDLCPLCGSRSNQPSDFNHWCVECCLLVALWPRVAQLVAIRDAAVEFYRDSRATPLRFAATMERLFALARQEADREKS